MQVKWPPARTGRLKLAAVRSEVGAELESESVDARRRALIVNLAKQIGFQGQPALAGRWPADFPADVQVKRLQVRTDCREVAAVRSDVGAELKSESADARQRALMVQLAKQIVPGASLVPTGTRQAEASRFPGPMCK